MVLGSLAAFLAVLTLLVFEVRSGHDPALSASAKSAAVRPQPQVIVRRIEDDYVITKVIPAPTQSGSAQGAAPAPVTRSSGGSAPAPAARPAPAAAPAPAPAPAPVTRTS